MSSELNNKNSNKISIRKILVLFNFVIYGLLLTGFLLLVTGLPLPESIKIFINNINVASGGLYAFFSLVNIILIIHLLKNQKYNLNLIASLVLIVVLAISLIIFLTMAPFLFLGFLVPI